MTPDLDQCTVVLAGAWNRAIFTPQWVAERLFRESVETLVQIEPPHVLKFQDATVTLIVAPERSQLAPRVDTDAAFSRMHEVALLLLGALPETPLGGVGVNFAFSINTSAQLRERGAALASWLGRDVALGTMQVRFELPDTPYSTNLRLDINQENSKVDVNFHHAADNARSGAGALQRLIAADPKRRALEWARQLVGPTLQSGSDA